MKKCMLLSFLLLNPFIARAMEDNFLSFFSSLFESNKVSSPLQAVQVNKNEFKKLLHVYSWSINGLSYAIVQAERSYLNNLITDKPTEFFLYCYNQSMHGYISFMSIMNDSLLDTCKEVCINGYSALGAAIIAENVSVKDKRWFVRKLKKKGFTLTAKDRTLIALELQDSIPVEQKQMMVALLQGQQKDVLASLPHEIRKYIVDRIMRLYKEKEWFYFLLR